MNSPPSRRILVGTPAYGGMVHTSYLRSLFDFLRAGIAFELTTIGNESLITRARNTILAGFHTRREFTHLLFLDADVQLPAEGLARMLDADVPVLGAAVALKAYHPDGSRIWNIGRCLGSQGRLLKVETVGTAALLLSRAATDALVEDAIATGRTYTPNVPVPTNDAAALHYDVFRTGVHRGQYLSEDYWACYRLRALGFDVCIDPAVITGHHGVIEI